MTKLKFPSLCRLPFMGKIREDGLDMAAVAPAKKKRQDGDVLQPPLTMPAPTHVIPDAPSATPDAPVYASAGVEAAASFATPHADLTLVLADSDGRERALHVELAKVMAGSEYFTAMLGGSFEEAGRSEITLADVDVQSAILAMRFVHGQRIHLTADNVVPLLALAQRWIMAPLSAHCEAYLDRCALTASLAPVFNAACAIPGMEIAQARLLQLSRAQGTDLRTLPLTSRRVYGWGKISACPTRP